MDANNNSKVRQKNGAIVMQALQCIDEPTTFANIVHHIASSQEVSAKKIKEPVKEVLHRAVEIGFVQRQAGKYSLGAANDHDEESEPEAEDKMGRRRRSRRRISRGSSRSRSSRRSRSRGSKRRRY